MRYILIIGLSICILLSGCAYFTPDTSSALSQSSQLQELQKQTKQLERQADALERLVDSKETLTNPSTNGDSLNPSSD
ncbi:MAG: hypothetical protein SAK29_03335 [Scytonema sp. PMC 1069.18]|nr:hypothetical protein [Scytonema sp. PMC 1069.18]MEC4884258.1 hypothetical protein [Scytonema sp. PMC 1070.18]